MHFRHEQLSLRMLYASMRHHSWRSQTSVGVQTDDDVPAATHAATATLTPVDAPVTTAYSVPILHFSGDSVGIQSCVPLNNVLSCMVPEPCCAADARTDCRNCECDPTRVDFRTHCGHPSCSGRGTRSLVLRLLQ